MTMQTVKANGTNGHTTRPELVNLDLGQVHPHPRQPRKRFEQIEELAASIKEKGVLEPILARPRDAGGYEIIFGERRWRASKLAKVSTIPAIVRVIGDQEAEEMMIVENGQREDLHELEEAEGYERLRTAYGMTVEQIAAKVGKSRASVYARMKLLSCTKKVRDAFYAGTIDASKALLLARIPGEKLQAEALADITKERETFLDDLDLVSIDDGEKQRSYREHALKLAPSYREAVAIVQSKFMLRLVDAPFDRDSATLVSKAGTCTACPKRTGNQKELFSDVKSADVCTDPACYRGKLDAHWEKVKEAAKAEGRKVLEDSATKKLFDGYDGRLTYGSGYREVEPKEGKKAREDAILARDPLGNIRELVKDARAEGYKPPTAAEFKEREKKRREREAKRTAAEKAKNRVRDLTIAALVEKAEGKVIQPDLLRALVFYFLRSGSQWEVLVDRGIIKKAPGYKQSARVYQAVVSKLAEKKLRGLLVELVAREDLENRFAEDDERGAYEMLCDHFKVDPEKFESEAKAAAGTGK